MRVKGYTQLIVWQKADRLAFHVYTITKKFPHDEQYGLSSQLRRAAVSIPTNLAEGTGRQNRNETKQFVNIALGSLAETEYLMSFCRRLNFLSKQEYEKFDGLCDELSALLWGFYKSFYQL